MVKKQLEIITEIIESDSKYLDDLKLIDFGFLDPIRVSQALTDEEMEGIFHNLRDIINVHEQLGASLNAAVQGSSTHKQKVLKIIASFEDAVLLVRLTK